ncbi:MAG: RNA polymerase sigma factor [Candidatus Methanofastidiosum sp.]|nr:RNA polymerase sigma factor [Methanofastidiosum sp.]
MCVKIIGNNDEAKDALQDIFVKLWTSRDSLESIKNIEAYAVTITRNYCLDKLRLRKENISIEKIYLYDDSEDQVNLEYTENYKLNLINSALTELTPNQQKVFVMRDIERMSFEEISINLGITEENIRVSLSRSRKKLKELVKEAIRRENNYGR